MGNKKVICASWIGRFGNRCHSYLYGKHIEDKFGHKFYIGRKWEGSVLFENPAPVFKDFSSLGFIYAGGGKQMPEFKENQEKLHDYNKNNNVFYPIPSREHSGTMCTSLGHMIL